MASASDVQRAYGLDLPIGSIIGENAKLAYALKEHEDEKLRQADAENMRYEDMLQGKYKYTNTPVDDYRDEMLNKAKEKLMEAQSKTKTPLTY